LMRIHPSFATTIPFPLHSVHEHETVPRWAKEISRWNQICVPLLNKWIGKLGTFTVKDQSPERGAGLPFDATPDRHTAPAAAVQTWPKNMICVYVCTPPERGKPFAFNRLFCLFKQPVCPFKRTW
jgi:hypothetical protein